MKKIVFALVALIVAAPAMGSNVDVTATQVGTTLEVQIGYNATDLPRAFGLDITVDAGTITGISNFITGESIDPNVGYGIFPASFNRYIDPCNPNWSDVNYTPLADPCDLPGDTEGGLGTSGITVEMGSLYVNGPNSPLLSGTLCNITVSGDCNVGLALNVGRAGIVMEDGNSPDTHNLYGCTVIELVSVPDVLAMNETAATTAITNAGLVVGIPITYECNEVEVADEVLAQVPSGGTPVPPGSSVDLWVSAGQPIVPDVVDMTQANAETAINDVCGLSVGSIINDCCDTIVPGNVIGTNPAAGLATCGTAVNIVVSIPCVYVPNIIGMTPAAADAAIVGASLVAGTHYLNENSSMTVGLVAEGGPIVGTYVPVGSTVDVFESKGDCMDGNHPDYAQWLNPTPGYPQHAKADCWCYPRQCRGDADGKKLGPFWVSGNDLVLLRLSISKLNSQLPPGGICSDYDHASLGPFRVSGNDLTIFRKYISKLQIPFVPACSGVGCDHALYGSPGACDANAVPNTEYIFWDDVGGD